MLSALEVANHNSRDSCWIIVSGKVYDVTEFLDEHPGGPNIILRYAGKDATEAYEPIHPPNAIEDQLAREKHLGPVDPSTIPAKAQPHLSTTVLPPSSAQLPPLSTIISLLDFEDVGRQHLSAKAWAYYNSGATDMASLALNRSSWNNILFVPRVMIDVTTVDTSTTLAGQKAALPFFIAPTGMAKLSHPRGEQCFSEGAGIEGIPFTVSTNASAGLDPILQSRAHDQQSFFFQLYMNRDRSKSSALLKKVAGMRGAKGERLIKAIAVTVDCPAPGKREPDEKAQAVINLDLGVAGGKGAAPDARGNGIGRAMGSYIDPGVTWKDIAWIREQVSSGSPSSRFASRHTRSDDIWVGAKGIQSVTDVLLAIHHGANVIWLSNHGGRSLDTAPPALYVLLELRRDHPWVFSLPGVEIYIDGGVRRGTDIVKALCLGAKGVALGRPFMYALQYGTEGIRHAIQILRDEIETTMRLIGATRVAELGPHFLNTKALLPLLNDPVSVPANLLPLNGSESIGVSATSATGVLQASAVRARL